MCKLAEEINGATCLDELFAISGRCRRAFGVWSKTYDNVVGLCLNRFKQIYGVSYDEYSKQRAAGIR
jgi:hypothetical protein